MTTPHFSLARTARRCAWQCTHALPCLILYCTVEALERVETALLAICDWREEHLPVGTRVDRAVDRVLTVVLHLVHECWFRAGVAWEARLIPLPPGSGQRPFAMIAAARAGLS